MKLTIGITATGVGSRSALAEAASSLDDLRTIIEDWCEGFEGEADDPEVEWSVTVTGPKGRT